MIENDCWKFSSPTNVLSVGQLVHWSIWIYFSKLLSVSQRLWSSMGGLFRASEGTLATKMMTIASTILLLQEMKILPTEMYCERCEAISPDVFKLRGNVGFFKCSTCKSMKSIRDNTVLSNSNLQLKRFVGLLWSFSEDRGRNYKEIINALVVPACQLQNLQNVE